jgi:hypothetical protein
MLGAGAIAVPVSTTVNDKLNALEAALNSRSFDRSDQLKRFLRYVCEMEVSGRGQELSEYSIGVHALGRGEDFSPAEDSIVRNRAYAVRKKLEEYYSHEAPDAPIRIELPKGFYTPRFLPAAEPSGAPAPVAIEEIHASAESPVPVVVERRAPTKTLSRSSQLLILGGVLLLGVVTGAAGLRAYLAPRLRPLPPEATRNAWGSMLQQGSTVLVSVGTPAQGFIREFPDSRPAVPGLYAVDEAVTAWYRRQRPNSAHQSLFQVPTFNSPLWGDAAGAVRVVDLLSSYGVRSELIAERLVAPPVFRNRNAILFGSPEYSETIAHLMQGLPLQVGFDPVAGDHIAWETGTDGTISHRFAPKRGSVNSGLKEVYGLITVLPAEGDGEGHLRSIIFSGISSAGTQAAAEYFVSPTHLSALATHLRINDGTVWPSTFQVLVHATTDRTVALSFAYETHRVIR